MSYPSTEPDFVLGLIQNLRFNVNTHHLGHRCDYVEHGQTKTIGKIERLAPELSAEHLSGQIPIGRSSITDVNIVADEVTVRTNHRRLALQEGEDRVRKNTALVQIARAKKLPQRVVAVFMPYDLA